MTQQVATTDAKLIAAKVYDPREPSIFGKGKKSERPTHSKIHCSCESCPLLANRQCVLISIFRSRCPYGKMTTESGPTQRSKGYYEWVKTRRESSKEVGWLGFATTKIAFIGDHVYLPYSHMDMNKRVAFGGHSSLFVSGTPFLSRENWTIETVLELIDFRPQSLMGGEITSYRKEVVPIFISHIREVDAEMWAELIAARPALDVTPNYVGRTALLRTLASPINIPPKDNRYPVAWKWDGEKVTTTDSNCYSSTWGGIRESSLVLSVVPAADATVKVADNAWVTNTTVFTD